MIKKLSLLIIVACCLGLTACSKDGEIDAFVTEFDSVTKEVIAKVNANPTAAGVDEAQKVFDGKKASLKAKWDGIKGARGFQVSDASKKKLMESVTKNVMEVTALPMKQMSAVMKDPSMSEKMTKLSKDFADTFQE